MMRLLSAAACAAMLGIVPQASAHEIPAIAGNAAAADFDIVHARIAIVDDTLVFRIAVSGQAGATRPTPVGTLAGSSVFAYVWPTSIDPYEAGFDSGAGILAMTVTAHPDFDDTPLEDENGDGNPDNDGNVWHSHWVVLGPDDACGPGALKVIDIPEGAAPRLPATWPGLPLLIDSPGFPPVLDGAVVEVRVPLDGLAGGPGPTGANYDGVTAGLRVSASVHAPLLCVADLFDVASGDLSLPGRIVEQLIKEWPRR